MKLDNRYARLLAVLSFAGMAFLVQANTKAAEKPVAIVNGEAIGRTDFDKAWARVPPPPPDFNDTQRKALKAELLGLMIDETLFQQFLRKNVPAPDQALVEKRVQELEKSLQASGHTLRQYCDDTGQTESRLRADIAAVIQWNAYVRKHATDSELKRFYDENRDLFDGIMLRASHIFLRVPSHADAKAHEEARRKLMAIRTEIMNGLDFAAAVKKYSEDRASISLSGDLGYFPPRRSEPDPVIRAASSLKIEQISNVVQSPHGYHLIKLTDRKPGKPSTFDECKDDVRLLWSEELRAKIIDDLRQAAKIEMNLP